MGTRRVKGTVTGSTLGSASTAPSTLSVGSIAHNPRNQRDDYDDVDELAKSILEAGVLQPIGVVRYEIFLSHFPEAEHAIGSHEWVAIYGNRRLAGARLAGLEEVPVFAVDRLGRDGMFDEAVLIENIHRSDLPPLREAQAIAALVERHGSQAKAGQRLGKTPGFVSQRLALLKLVPELQAALRAGELRLEDARSLGRLPVDTQVQAWAELQSPPLQPLAEEEEEAAPADAPPQAAGRLYGVNGADRKRTRRIALGPPAELATELRKHLPSGDLAELIKLLSD